MYSGTGESGDVGAPHRGDLGIDYAQPWVTLAGKLGDLTGHPLSTTERRRHAGPMTHYFPSIDSPSRKY